MEKANVRKYCICLPEFHWLDAAPHADARGDNRTWEGYMNRRQFVGGALLSGAALAWPAEDPAKPKVRAITAFLKLDRARFREQIQETLRMLRQAKRAVEAGGYQVEGVRID